MSLNFKYNPGKRKTCELGHWAIAILVILCILSGISTIVFGVLVGKPGVIALKMKDATCRVVEWRFISRLTCDCSGLKSDDPYCTSKFPCLQIMVAYEPWRTEIPVNHTDSFKTSTMIRESEVDFNSRFKHCSFHSCETEYRSNQLLMENFKSKYGQIGEFYLCKYNPDDPSQVVTRINFNKTDFLVSLIVPSSAFVVCMFALIGIFLGRLYIKRRNAAAKAKQNQEISYVSYNSPAFVPDEDVGSNQFLSNDNLTAIEIRNAGKNDEIHTEYDNSNTMSDTDISDHKIIKENMGQTEISNSSSNNDRINSDGNVQETTDCCPSKSSNIAEKMKKL